MNSYFILMVIGFISVVVVLMYNSLISKKNEIENAVGGVHTFLQQRADLIPNLVETVKQYAAHEAKLFTELANARNVVLQPVKHDGDIQNMDTQLTKAFGHVKLLAENYPELKANENFVSLQGSLNEIEGQLSAARRTYNAAVVQYNNSVESIPMVFLASILGYKRKSVFQVSTEAAAKPDIGKLFGKAG